jgi:hypothetical protein
MPRPRQRLCLEQGLRLDLNRLIQQGTLRRGATVGSSVITWTNSYTGELVANALISANMESEHGGWFRIQIGGLDQRIDLVTQPRYFGGRQWYFRCSAAPRCLVLWRFGQSRFYSRAAWGRQFAYASQFATPLDRAHRGKAKIKARLIGDCDPEEWELPPKPKWMRWHTYNRQVDKFDHYERKLEALCLGRVLRILDRG